MITRNHLFNIWWLVGFPDRQGERSQ